MAESKNCLFGLMLKNPKIQLDHEDKIEFGCCSARYITGGYVALQIKGKTVLLHRAVMKGSTKNIDHINGIVTDCRKVNLREATHSQNNLNAGVRADNTSGYRGVTLNGKYWRARIFKDGKMHNIGNYSTKESAAKAWNKKALELFGEFAQLNVITE